MVGMLQIITYLLCIYLIFKGIEIYQIAQMSSRESRAAGLSLGTVMIVGALIVAAGFALWITMQAEGLGTQMPRVP